MWSLARALLFMIPAEEAHGVGKVLMRMLARFIPAPRKIQNNPIGLAAGFDKNAELLDVLPKFGFGHVEIGTVTPRPQGGNPRPRLFRNAENKTLFNRMGFNNLGAGIVSGRVRRIRPKLPEGFKVGINLGKNKDTPDESAAEDYAAAARSFLDTADYFVINVSSPNTPGLRALQTPEALIPILNRVRSEIESIGRSIPVWVKLAPELTGTELQTLIEALDRGGASGFILTNTQGGVYIDEGKELTGGWSGQNLTTLSRQRLIEARSYTRLPLISVGGIMTPEEALERFRAGASEIQLYTGFVYGGPFLIRNILKAIRKQA
jgi:dihydroorotate dehydrogenase